MLMLFSCSSDDDSSDVNLTSAEILALLEGKWMVSGELSTTNSETQESIEDRYKGMIEFINNHKFSFTVSEGNKYNVGDFSIYPEEIFVNDAYVYSLLKKDGKNYITFSTLLPQPSNFFNFEIVSLNKNSFKLVLDTDIVIDNKTVGRIYMTMYSIK